MCCCNRSGPTPHKCPVCYGTGQRYVAGTALQITYTGSYVNCQACQGTGVVWWPNQPVNPQPLNLSVTGVSTIGSSDKTAATFSGLSEDR